jgi:Uma2 family endonuclease
MSTSLAEPRIARLTVDQVHAMVEAGIVHEGAPIELIDGVLIHKDRSASGEDPMSIGKEHSLVVSLLGELDVELAQRGCHMRTQNPLSLPPHDEPEPDGAILRGRPRAYTDRVPGAADAGSVIEVSDSSLAYDRKTKLALYARSGIVQYVIVNLSGRCIEIYEQPSPDGSYQQITVRRAGEAIELRLPDGERFGLGADRILP